MNNFIIDNQLQLFHQGVNYELYKFFGCHKVDDEDTFVFRVWAPHAKSVSLVGTFNNWDNTANVMYKLADGECFECTISNVKVGSLYKYSIKTHDGRTFNKADPYAFSSNLPQTDDSVVTELPKNPTYNRTTHSFSQPMNIFEVNLLSWKRHEDNNYYTYEELEKELVPYVANMGYTHVEFMPMTEYPFDGSWGYQVTGYFSVVSRLGSLSSFKSLINAFHRNGIKVILDWVPAHFAKDAYALYEFDGQPLYECPSWDRMEHRGWGTRRFDFGRPEIDSFLISSACFFIEQYDVDGLRVDAVASMLYLDYDKEPGQWIPNKFGGNHNLEAIAFLRKLNSVICDKYDGIITIAEESTAFYGITKSIQEDGLGFTYKWNMGWMNDILSYCKTQPVFRKYNHNKLNFSMMYAFSENFILPLSHDEVVHMKGSILNKMPGEYEDKFSQERALLGFMFAHPGKKLNFMGYEIAQYNEWRDNGSLDYFLPEQFELHAKMQRYVQKLNKFYTQNSPLYEIENSWNGFNWLVVDDADNNLLAFERIDNSDNKIIAIINFSGKDIKDYQIKLQKGTYRLCFNSDDVQFGGYSKVNKTIYTAKRGQIKQNEWFITIDIPKFSCLYLKNNKKMGD